MVSREKLSGGGGGYDANAKITKRLTKDDGCMPQYSLTRHSSTSTVSAKRALKTPPLVRVYDCKATRAASQVIYRWRENTGVQLLGLRDDWTNDEGIYHGRDIIPPTDSINTSTFHTSEYHTHQRGQDNTA